MKKLFTFWRRKDEPHSPSSHVPIGRASTHHPTQPGYNLRDKDLKKLHKAASVGDLEKVKEYLQLKKHDVNIRDREYRTPLHLACANGYSNIVSLLIEKQCKINVCDSENRSPLTKAVQCAKEDCATILLGHGADPNLADLDGNTALHYAVCGQSVSLVEKLLEHKANLEDQNKDGYTPLLLAITENNAKMVEYLLKRGADVNASDKNQRTALMIALSDEPTNLVSLLLQQEVDLSCQDIYGFTAEEYASFNGFTVYHQLIASYGKEKKVEQTNSEDTTLGTTFDREELKEGEAAIIFKVQQDPLNLEELSLLGKVYSNPSMYHNPSIKSSFHLPKQLGINMEIEHYSHKDFLVWNVSEQNGNSFPHQS
nr:ankyrin repeat domain-containing protein 7 [Mirounga angustirostris]